jgi:eukaryotic-like serine/threonine-protein kinase
MLKYFKSREFFITVAAVLGFAILSYVVFFFLFLPFYTNHGEEVGVPEVAKLKLEEAISQLEEAGLRYEVADSLYLNHLPPLSIISQDPIGGSKVKPGRRVYLTVNKVVAPVVKFPDISGTQYQAKLRLEGAGLVLNKVTFQPHEFADLVLGATFNGKVIKEGDEVRKGSKIDIVVGKGKGNERVEVPDLIGQTQLAAISTILRLGLSPSKTTYDPTSTKPPGTVIQQYPNFAPGDSIHVGQEIDIWISGPQPDEAIDGFDGVIDGANSNEEEQ